MTNPQEAEVAWYLKNGRYKKERITYDGRGRPYVIGDWSWRRGRPYKQEWIEPLMWRDGVYD